MERSPTSLADAVEQWVKPGSSVYITGFTHLINFAAAHEIIRQGIRDLHLIRLTPDVIYDQLVAAGCGSRLTFSYLGNPGVGQLLAIRRAIESGQLELREYTHGSLIAALRAGASGAPFAVAPSIGGSALLEANPDVREVRNPYDGQDVSVVPAITPDVAIVHVQRADRAGNGQVWGCLGDIPEAAYAAKRVILTTEELVSGDEIRADPNRTVIIGKAVDALVHLPRAAHPSYAQGVYARDSRFYREWAAISAEQSSLDEYLDQEVRGLADHDEYMRRNKERLNELEAVGSYLTPTVNYGQNEALASVQD